MAKARIRIFIGLFLGPLFASNVNAQQSSSNAADVGALIADIKAHHASCDGDATKNTTFCVNEKADLLERQHALGIDDAQIKQQIGTRGWRWP